MGILLMYRLLCHYTGNYVTKLAELVLEVVLSTPRFIVFGDFNSHVEASSSGLKWDCISSITTMGPSHVVTEPTPNAGNMLNLMSCTCLDTEAPFMSRIIRPVIWRWFMDSCHSGFWPGYSTEIELKALVSDLFLDINRGNCALLILLGLSVAFDTLDHDLLGIYGTILNWFHFPTQRFQKVVMGERRDCGSLGHFSVGFSRAPSCCLSHSMIIL